MNWRTFLLTLSFIAIALPVAAEETAAEPDEAAEPAAEADAEPAKENKPIAAVAPDRPTYTYGAATVPTAHAQIEIGGEFSTSDGASQLAFPVFARVGVAEYFELRAGLPSFIIPLGDEDTDLGSLQLGAKVAGDVTDNLSIGALPYFDIAASAGGQRTFAESTYGFVLLGAFMFSDSFGMSANLGTSVGPGSTDEAGPRELFYSASLAASVMFGALCITAEGFTELGQYADPNVGGSLSGGYNLTDAIIVDVYGGASAQSEVTNVFAGLGLTIAR